MLCEELKRVSDLWKRIRIGGERGQTISDCKKVLEEGKEGLSV
jgi:hypothetical protein